MNGRLIRIVGLSALALPSIAHAQLREGGFEGGLRSGYGLVLGKATGTARGDMSEAIAGIIPVWLDLGYRVDANLFVGGFFQYGYGITGGDFPDACDLDGFNCFTGSTRVGAQLHYHFAPASTASPWIGYGIGYEWFAVGFEADGGDFSVISSGFEFANFQIGLDFTPGPNIYLGPFLSFSLDQFNSVESDCRGFGCQSFLFDDSIDDKSLHHWFVLGIRGGYTAYGVNSK